MTSTQSNLDTPEEIQSVWAEIYEQVKVLPSRSEFKPHSKVLAFCELYKRLIYKERSLKENVISNFPLLSSVDSRSLYKSTQSNLETFEENLRASESVAQQE